MFAMAAMRANLEEVMTEAAYQHMFTLAAQLATACATSSRGTSCHGA
jgi:glutamate-1-semialdehyde aminotransferase